MSVLTETFKCTVLFNLHKSIQWCHTKYEQQVLEIILQSPVFELYLKLHGSLIIVFSPFFMATHSQNHSNACYENTLNTPEH